MVPQSLAYLTGTLGTHITPLWPPQAFVSLRPPPTRRTADESLPAIRQVKSTLLKISMTTIVTRCCLLCLLQPAAWLGIVLCVATSVCGTAVISISHRNFRNSHNSPLAASSCVLCRRDLVTPTYVCRTSSVTIPLSGYVEFYLIGLWSFLTCCVGTGPVIGCPPNCALKH